MDKQHPNLQVLCSFLVLDGPLNTLSNQRPSVAFSQPFFTETFRKNLFLNLTKSNVMLQVGSIKTCLIM